MFIVAPTMTPETGDWSVSTSCVLAVRRRAKQSEVYPYPGTGSLDYATREKALKNKMPICEIPIHLDRCLTHRDVVIRLYWVTV